MNDIPQVILQLVGGSIRVKWELEKLEIHLSFEPGKMRFYPQLVFFFSTLYDENDTYL
jgi:hypothetical protein